VFGSSKKAADILDSLTRKGRLIQIERGKYIPVPIKAPNQRWMPNEFVVAALWMGDVPYYIGYFTMFNYWGFTEQVPQKMFVLNTKKNAKKTIGSVGYEAVRIDPRKYYGIIKIKIEDEDIRVSDRERTLVDFVYKPLGSFNNIEATIRNNFKKIDLRKFIRYLIKFPIVSVRKRAGYILEKLGCRGSLLKKLKASLGSEGTYIVLDASKKTRRGRTNKEWKIIDNR
jgi:predicted transcriptional regulator of viral defense system